MADFFTDFDLKFIETRRGTIRLRMAGDGPPLLLLHGNPQTHAMWHKVAPELAKTTTVICPDLCGYGQSFKPECTLDHAPYSKREMAGDMVDLMEGLGFLTFDLAGHDRGARVSHRLAIDYPERVKQLALLDIVPTIEHFEQTDMSFAMGYYHWFGSPSRTLIRKPLSTPHQKPGFDLIPRANPRVMISSSPTPWPIISTPCAPPTWSGACARIIALPRPSI